MRVDLADHEDVFAAQAAGPYRIRHGLADGAFGAAFAVHLGGIDHPVSDLEGAADGGDFAGSCAGGLAHPPSAETQRRDRPAIGEKNCFHARFEPRYSKL